MNKYKKLFNFLKSLLKALLFLSIYIGGVALCLKIFGYDSNAPIYYILVVLISLLLYVYREKLTPDNIKKLLSKTSEVFVGTMVIVGYILLSILAIVILFLVGGWIASLSATTIIIILLVMILLK